MTAPRRFLFTTLALFGSLAAAAQENLTGREWTCRIAADGTLRGIEFADGTSVPFFEAGAHAGPAFYARLDGRDTTARWHRTGACVFEAELADVVCRLRYADAGDHPALEVTLRNAGHTPVQPAKMGLRLGVDTYMDTYPAWFSKYFPTLLRCEKSHFYGYLQTPSGRTLALAAAEPVASWSVDYSPGYPDPAPHWFWGHRIESLNLDLLAALPLPERHPQDAWQLLPGEERRWRLHLLPVAAPDDTERAVSRAAGIPVIALERTSCAPGGELTASVWGGVDAAELTDAAGELLPLAVAGDAACARLRFELPQTGLYTLCVRKGDKVAEAVVSVPRPWLATVAAARDAALRYPQKATSHIESCYGFYSAFLGARHAPAPRTDSLLDARFEMLFDLLHDTIRMEPRYFASRIQNTSGMLNQLAERFRTYGRENDLRRACRLADWLIRTAQRADGAYCNRGTVYTSVIYVAKNILDLSVTEREYGKRLGRKRGREWLAAADRHYVSAKRAVDQLVASDGNFQTEGEHTFEDGMISCSALQIGRLALLQRDSACRRRYTGAMLRILASHDCLTQLRVPDARRRQGTMRYWEAQYDVLMLPNMFNSPHGWSAWRTYATYYAYLLTGDERWLRETFDAAAAFSWLLDTQAGTLRWAFVVDPRVEAEQVAEPDRHYTADSLSFGNPHPHLYPTRRFVFGERYVPMVSDWQGVNTQDNDVHEVFKCIGETVLCNAFVAERADGTLAAYNCTLRVAGDTLEVVPSEAQIRRLHCNFRTPRQVRFRDRSGHMKAGCRWFE